MIITLGNFAIAKYNSTIDLLVNSGVILESEDSQAAFQRYRKGHFFTTVKLKTGHP